jgi:signal recognition particle subunit SRP54
MEDFLEQMQMLKKMGPLQGLLGMLPGMGKQLKDLDIDDRQMGRVEAIIRSMTPSERTNIKLLTQAGGKRRKRIARGSGTSVAEVNRLIKQFQEVQKLMKSVGKMAGTQGMKPKGARGQVAQAAAVRKMAKSGQLPGGMGGFAGLSPAPRSKD